MSESYEEFSRRADARDNGDERLGVMRHVKLGMDDRDRVALMFDLYVTESTVASQWITGMENIEKIIRDAGVSDVKRLEGQTCWVDTSKPNMSIFIDVAKL